MDLDIIKDDIIKHILFPCSNPNIIVKSISADDILNKESEKYLFDSIHPDYVIMSCKSDFSGIEELEKLLLYKYGINIDLTVVSPYILFEKCEKERVAIYCEDSLFFEKLRYIKTSDEKLEESIKKSIFSKLSTPIGIKFIE